MVSLPIRDDGLGLPRLANTAVSQFKGSREATGVLSALMMSRVSKLEDTQAKPMIATSLSHQRKLGRAVEKEER